jgi:type I restriction enzyme M protein
MSKERRKEANLQAVGLSQQELESRLWEAANSLRGPVDPTDYKAYIFPMLFYKRICNVWDEEHVKAEEDYGTDLSPEVEADYHRFILPQGCHWRDLRRAVDNVGVVLQRNLDRIQQANPETLAGIFGDVAWGNKDRLPESALLSLIAGFDSLDLSPSKVGHDVLGAAYEYLLKQFADASGSKAGEFFTPRAVVRLLTRILEPKPSDSVYDPACGSGGMLIEAANEVLESGGSLAQMRFYGQEASMTTAAIARMNLYIHDIEDAKVLRGDTLRDPKFLDRHGHLQQFDIVIANPPFSLKNWGADRWVADPWGRAVCGLPPKTNGDLAWVQHMVASMKPGTGRLGVVMPHGVLFRGGAEGRIRECLLKSDQLDSIIGLPPNLFYSTSIPACLLIFRASKPQEHRGRVLLVDASKRFLKGRNQNSMTEADVKAIVSAYRTHGTRNDDSDLPCRLISHPEVQANDWDLNIGRYLQMTVLATGDVSDALIRLTEAQAVLHAAEQRLSERLKAAGYA